MPYKFSRRSTQPYMKSSRKGLVKATAHRSRKPASAKYRKPVRFRQGNQTAARSAKRVVNSLVRAGVLEPKQKEGVAFNEKPLLQRCSDNTQYVSFTPSPSSSTGISEGSNFLNLTTLAQGTGAGQYIGKYINVKSLFMRFNIMIPTIDEGTTSSINDFKGMTERHIRVLLVAPKLSAVPQGQTATTEDSLFLDYAGKEYGLVNTSNKPSWELMQAPINKKMWVVLKDNKYTVSPARIDTFDATSRPILKDHNLSGETYYSASWNETHHAKLGGASELNINCSIPLNKKVSMNTVTHVPEDLNVAYRFIVISHIPGMKQADQKTTNNASYGNNRILVSARSFMQFIDA